MNVFRIHGEQTLYVHRHVMVYYNGIYFAYHGVVLAEENFIDIVYSTT